MGIFDIFKKKNTKFNKNSFEESKNSENKCANADSVKAEGYELTKKATIFETGGQRPTKDLLESWIGAVCWQNEKDKDIFSKEGFTPLAMIFLENLPYVPQSVSDIKLINLFISENIWNDTNEDINKYFIIQTYKTLDNLVRCDYKSNSIKPFPLYPKLVEDDTPMDYPDGEKYYTHKVGGYETFCQDSIYIEAGYEFIFQIASDEKAELNIVDGGNFYFYYNKEKNDWKVEYDFY